MTSEEGRQLVESMVNVGNLVLVVWGDRTVKPACGYASPTPRGHTPIETIQTFAMAYVQLESLCSMMLKELAERHAGTMGPNGPKTPEDTYRLFIKAVQQESVRMSRETPADSSITTLPSDRTS